MTDDLRKRVYANRRFMTHELVRLIVREGPLRHGVTSSLEFPGDQSDLVLTVDLAGVPNEKIVDAFKDALAGLPGVLINRYLNRYIR